MNSHSNMRVCVQQQDDLVHLRTYTSLANHAMIAWQQKQQQHTTLAAAAAVAVLCAVASTLAAELHNIAAGEQPDLLLQLVVMMMTQLAWYFFCPCKQMSDWGQLHCTARLHATMLVTIQ